MGGARWRTRLRGGCPLRMSGVYEHGQKHFRTVENAGDMGRDGWLPADHDEPLNTDYGRNVLWVVKRATVNADHLAHFGQSFLHTPLEGRSRHLSFQFRRVLEQSKVRVQ